MGKPPASYHKDDTHQHQRSASLSMARRHRQTGKTNGKLGPS